MHVCILFKWNPLSHLGFHFNKNAHTHEQTTIGIHKVEVPKRMYTLFCCKPVVTKWENCLQPQRFYFRKWFLLCKRYLFSVSKLPLVIFRWFRFLLYQLGAYRCPVLIWLILLLSSLCTNFDLPHIKLFNWDTCHNMLEYYNFMKWDSVGCEVIPPTNSSTFISALILQKVSHSWSKLVTLGHSEKN